MTHLKSLLENNISTLSVGIYWVIFFTEIFHWDFPGYCFKLKPGIWRYYVRKLWIFWSLFVCSYCSYRRKGRHWLDENQVRVACQVPHLVCVDMRRNRPWYFWAVMRVLASHSASTDTILARRYRIGSWQLLPQLLLTQWCFPYHWVVVKVLTLLLVFLDTTLWGRDVSFSSCRSGCPVSQHGLLCHFGGFITSTDTKVLTPYSTFFNTSWAGKHGGLGHLVTACQVTKSRLPSWCLLIQMGLGTSLWCLTGVECLFSKSFLSY